MEDIYALLNINKGVVQNFHLQAERLVDHQTELVINRCIRSLKEIEESVMSDKSVKVSQQSIDEVILKVIKNSKSHNQDYSIWSIRELRIVSYYLMKLQGNDDAYQYALTLLDKNWRDLFLNGLSFYCLDSWNSIEPSLRIQTCELLRKKLQEYKDGNKKYMAMKNHANLFDEAGPYRISALLSQKKEQLTNAPSYFCNKPSTLTQSYYSDVIVKYCEANKVMDIDYIDEIFELHKYDRTKKLVIADLVERLHIYGDELQRTRICKYANKVLGDITLSSTWAPFSGATEKDAHKLKKAKKLVNLWFNQKIIETFFEVCVQDRFRKEFWLRYVDNFSGFRIVGSTITMRKLQADSRISNVFLPYFIKTDSYTATTSALVLFMKNKMLVEFSDTGALYVYDQGHKMVDLITKRKYPISNTNDLKITTMMNLIETNDWGYSTYHEKGRMTHQGYWQGRLSGWLKEMVLSSNNTGVSFFDNADNEIFKAKPIDKEEFIPTEKPKVEQTSMAEDAPEYENLCLPSEQDLFKSAPRSMETKRPKNQYSCVKLAVFEVQVNYSITSIELFNNTCKIVANKRGYFVYVSRKGQYAQIRELDNDVSPTGYIWVQSPNANGWRQILHVLDKQALSIGYVKEVRDSILYKQELNQTGFMIIKLL